MGSYQSFITMSLLDSSEILSAKMAAGFMLPWIHLIWGERHSCGVEGSNTVNGLMDLETHVTYEPDFSEMKQEENPYSALSSGDRKVKRIHFISARSSLSGGSRTHLRFCCCCCCFPTYKFLVYEMEQGLGHICLHVGWWLKFCGLCLQVAYP